jgi:hypothetical protein
MLFFAQYDTSSEPMVAHAKKSARTGPLGHRPKIESSSHAALKPMISSQMSAPYTVPKREIQVEVVLPAGPPMRLFIFLNERAETHSGFERPSDLLDGVNLFIPAVDDRGELVLLNRDALLMVSVAAEHELSHEDPTAEDLAVEETTHALVEVVLENGMALRGLITYLLPPARRRLQDFLNSEDRFLTLKDSTFARLINKHRITRITPV